jgi:hypothetical protein
MAQEKQVYIVDCETQPFDGKRQIYTPFCWGVLWEDDYGGGFVILESTKEFIEFVYAHDGLYYAHNGGKFDWYFVTDYIDVASNLLFINGRLSKFSIGNSEFRDSYSILPIPLAAYKKDKFDYELLNDYQRNKTVIHKYLYNDCRYLADLVFAFRDSYGDALTTPSAALKFWTKQTGMKADDYKTDNENYDTYYRAFYFGGRCQSRMRGEFNREFHCWDINSAYPFAMIHNHPFGYHDIESSKESDIIGRSFVVVKAQVTNGAFPFRNRYGGMDFPTDNEEREYNITGWEFIVARELGMLKNYRVLSVRNHCDKISFKDYVNHFFAIKKSVVKDSPEYILSKLFLNGLSGKFGQNFREFKEYKLHDANIGIEFKTFDDDIERVWSFVDAFNDKLGLYESEPIGGKWYNVAVVASITGFVRAYLLRAIKASDNFLYCDTDSIFACDFSGEVSNNLGAWSHDGTYSKGFFCGKKLYYADSADKNRWKDKYAHKGVKIERKDYVRLVQGETVEYHFNEPNISLKRKKINYTTRKITML